MGSFQQNGWTWAVPSRLTMLPGEGLMEKLGACFDLKQGCSARPIRHLGGSCVGSEGRALCLIQAAQSRDPNL